MEGNWFSLHFQATWAIVKRLDPNCDGEGSLAVGADAGGERGKQTKACRQRRHHDGTKAQERGRAPGCADSQSLLPQLAGRIDFPPLYRILPQSVLYEIVAREGDVVQVQGRNYPRIVIESGEDVPEVCATRTLAGLIDLPVRSEVRFASGGHCARVLAYLQRARGVG